MLRVDFLGRVCGRELRALPFSDDEYKADAAKAYTQRFHSAILEALHKGRPALAVASDMYLVCGYDDAQPPLLGQVVCLSERKVQRLREYPWRVVVPGEGVTPMDRCQADIEALKFAVNLGHDRLGEHPPANKLSGQGAFALWASLLRDPEGWGAHFYHANVLGHLGPHRTAAVQYLRAMAQRHASAAARSLEDASAIYAEVVDSLQPADAGKETLSAPEGREQLARLVERVAQLEKQAVERLEATLTAMR